VQIGAVDDIASHPIGAFLRAGFNVGVNTDNRLMSNVMPSSELHTVAVAHALDADAVTRLVTNAMMSSFAPMDVRRRVVATIADPARSSR
jgi:adenosine deaminase